MKKNIIRLPQVITKTGLSRATIYLKMKSGEFPQSLSLGERARGWRERDIDDWIDSLSGSKQSA